MFDFQIRCVFDSARKCIEFETKLLTRINAANKDEWFNQHNGGPKFSRTNKKPSLETCQKISVANKGRKRLPFSAEHCRKISEAAIGRGHSAETKLKLSKMQKGIPKGPKTEEHKKKISLALTGSKESPETCLKKSLAHRGKKRPPRSKEWCKNIAKSKKGKNAGMRWVHNTSEHTRIHPHEIAEYLRNNYILGMLSKVID